jgi:putative transposase
MVIVKQILTDHRDRQLPRHSMGSVGDCFDNALCESFFAALECEVLDRYRFDTHAQARMTVFDFIEGWYNPIDAIAA